jgi:ABC-2 type transport system permease protein
MSATTLNAVLTDSTTMLSRTLLRMRRYPSMTLMLIGMPVVFLLLFVYVLGGSIGAGLPGGGDRGDYLVYVVPGILLMTVVAVAQGTAVSVAMDVHEGIVARFRTMAIARSALLTGHVLGALVQTVIALAVVAAVAVAMGFRTEAGPLGWLGALGVLMALAFAVTWLCVALGLVSDSVETASNSPMPLILLPFFGSGFVPTDSMPAGLRWFAEHQPFTAAMESVRGFLAGDVAAADLATAAAWVVGIGALSFWWAMRLYARPDR